MFATIFKKILSAGGLSWGVGWFFTGVGWDYDLPDWFTAVKKLGFEVVMPFGRERKVAYWQFIQSFKMLNLNH